MLLTLAGGGGFSDIGEEAPGEPDPTRLLFDDENPEIGEPPIARYAKI